MSSPWTYGGLRVTPNVLKKKAEKAAQNTAAKAVQNTAANAAEHTVINMNNGQQAKRLSNANAGSENVNVTKRSMANKSPPQIAISVVRKTRKSRKSRKTRKSNNRRKSRKSRK